jgi:hypothetical protein
VSGFSSKRLSIWARADEEKSSFNIEHLHHIYRLQSTLADDTDFFSPLRHKDSKPLRDISLRWGSLWS